jgi:spore coat protein H
MLGHRRSWVRSLPPGLFAFASLASGCAESDASTSGPGAGFTETRSSESPGGPASRGDDGGVSGTDDRLMGSPSDEDGPGAAQPLSPPGRAGGAAGLGPPVPDDGEQTWVFDPSEVHVYQLSLDAERWAALQRDARDEQYTEADLSAGGRLLGRVGLRFKGNLGTLVSCFADDGTPRCEKLSMKLKFDEYVLDQRFFGLKRLNFNSMLFDDTLMHERLAYRVYREMGVVAPRSAHARLIINGEDWGLFSLVEDVDGRFTDHHFDGGDGNLYKEAWPGNADEAVLSAALETNEELAEHSGFLQFQADLLAAPSAGLPAVAERYLDVDATLAYLAVDQSITNWDGVSAFFCNGDSCENHNYYWYQDQAGPRWTLVPWDLDNTFDASPLVGVPGLFEVQADCAQRFDAMGRTLRAPGCDRLLQALISTGPARYVAQLDRLLQGPFAPGVIDGWIDEIEEQLTPEVLTDARGPEPSTFEGAVARLRGTVEGLRERAMVELDARR